jgi:hypothetical protein
LAGALADRSKEQVEAARNRLRLRLGATSSNKLVPWRRKHGDCHGKTWEIPWKNGKLMGNSWLVGDLQQQC